MGYLKSRLPKDLAIAVGLGCLVAVPAGYLTAWAAALDFAKEYPHDGQNGLGVLAVFVFSVPLWGVLTMFTVFVARTARYRRLLRVQDEQAFNEELIADRTLSEGQRPDNITA